MMRAPMDATELLNDIPSWSGWLLKAEEGAIEEGAIMEGRDQRKKLPRFGREDVARILAKGESQSGPGNSGPPG